MSTIEKQSKSDDASKENVSTDDVPLLIPPHLHEISKEAHNDSIKIFIGTYNVNEKPPPATELVDWLSVDKDPPVIYAIGLQEIDVSVENLLLHKTPREKEWLTAITKALHPKASYRKLKVVRLVGMLLVVFIQEKYMDHVSEVASGVIGTGMYKMGNKGGVGIRFKLGSSTYCFVNCHLAAHVENVKQRNRDYRHIRKRLTFSSTKSTTKVTKIENHQNVFWMGDVNSRLSSDVYDMANVKEHLKGKNHTSLLQYDQLLTQKAKNKIFVGYREAPITFRPTYKYEPGTDDWDSKKNRVPAWCDRILWKGRSITNRFHFY